MARKKQEPTRPEVIVNGARIDVTNPSIKYGGTEPDIMATISFRVGNSGPTPLYFIGSQLSLQYDDFGPSTFRVIGIDEEIEDQQLAYQIRLREVKPTPSLQDTLNILYGSVFQTIMNRIRLHAIVETLEERNLLTSAEHDNKLLDVAERFLVQYAADIVSQSDAVAMRDYVVNQLKQGGAASERFGHSQDG